MTIMRYSIPARLAALVVSMVSMTGMLAAEPAGRPVVVELFTSQGCSSCPPADAFLGRLAERDDVIALGFHVDYWDYIGWKDPFASPDFTDRQRRYGRALRLRTIYTPQMVVDGIRDVVGSRERAVEQAMAAARQGEFIDVPITLNPLGARAVEARVAAAPRGGKALGEAEIWVVAYDDRHVTPVPRGENQGRTLSDHNVVRGLWRGGVWNGRAMTLRIDASAWPVRSDRVAVLLQAKGWGPILGAASMRFPK